MSLASKTCAIVPVKALAHAKRRLAPVLPAEARRQLVLAMLEDVLAASRAVTRCGRIVVVTPDRAGGQRRRRARLRRCWARTAARAQCRCRAGLAACQRTRRARRRWSLPADVPLATPTNCAAGAGRRRRRPRRASRSRRPQIGRGTNALTARRRPTPGAELRRRTASCGTWRTPWRGGSTLRCCSLPGLAADIDEPQRPDRLLASGSVSATHFLQAHMAARRRRQPRRTRDER